jgi:hypothetical protein
LDAGASDMRQHILYLQRMASWSRKAAQMAQEHSLSAQDDRGGPTATQELRELIAALMLSYQEVLGIRPIHTVDQESHLAERGFTGFVKQALRLYAPEGVVLEPRPRTLRRPVHERCTQTGELGSSTKRASLVVVLPCTVLPRAFSFCSRQARRLVREETGQAKTPDAVRVQGFLGSWLRGRETTDDCKASHRGLGRSVSIIPRVRSGARAQAERCPTSEAGG